MKNVHDEIEKELLTYSGTTFTAPSEALGWLHQAMFRIAEKTAEAVRVRENRGISDTINASEGAYEPDVQDIILEEGYNQAVTEQTKLASGWLGKE